MILGDFIPVRCSGPGSPTKGVGGAYLLVSAHPLPSEGRELSGWKRTDTSCTWDTQTPISPPGAGSLGLNLEDCSEPGGSESCYGWEGGLTSAPGAWNSTWHGLQPCPTWLTTTQFTQDSAQAARPKQLRWAYSPLPAGPGVRQGDLLQGQLCWRN